MLAAMNKRLPPMSYWPPTFAGLFLAGVVLMTAGRYLLAAPLRETLGGIVMVLGVLALGFALIRPWAKTTPPGAKTTVVVVIATWFVWIYVPFATLGAKARFYADRAEYDAAVATAGSGRTLACSAEGRCLVDGGPPRRILFLWDGGANERVGIVHDTSGRLATMPHMFPKPFGGGLVGCEPIDDDYYFCTFD
jgi:hypothetical protein